MTQPEQPPAAPVLRGFGWDIDSPFSSNRGDLLPIGSYGHTGFTGTSLWIDPTTKTYIILLTNAVHPRGGNAIALRSKVATAVAATLPLTDRERSAARAKHHRLQRSAKCGAAHELPQRRCEEWHRCFRGT
jgi:CubicO group peptidase (beta-lactamase class C family)